MKMIEIINGNPTTLETVNLALLCQKIDKESKVSLQHTWPGPNILATGTGTGTVSVSMARTGNVRDLSPLQWPEPRLHQDLVLGTGTDQN